MLETMGSLAASALKVFSASCTDADAAGNTASGNTFTETDNDFEF